MPPVDSVPEFETRRSFYKIDNRVRSILAAAWPIIAPTIDQSIKEVIDGVLELPIGKRVAPHRESITKLELAHFQALLDGDLDRRYAESCRRTVEREAEIGLDARIRSSAGNTVLRGALDALARAHRFSPGKLAERAKVVSQVISFDVANAMTLHRQAAERAAHSRRDAIDAAITEFDGAIGEVIEAIKETSATLTLTGSTLRQIAEDTLGRMDSASSASAETARRMEATVTATEELSGSIQEIGRQATNGLGMAQSAVADTERTQSVIGTLNDAAERIGSVVGTISAIAA
jgi:methyl-accepting chemotaxis protein